MEIQLSRSSITTRRRAQSAGEPYSKELDTSRKEVTRMQKMKDDQLRRKRKQINSEKGNAKTPSLASDRSKDNGCGGRQRRTTQGNQAKHDTRLSTAAKSSLIVQTCEQVLCPELMENDEPCMTVGDVVWARLSCKAPWWPATIIDPRLCGYELNDRVWVFWLGDSRISDVDKGLVKNFAENFAECFRCGGSQNYTTSVRKAIEIFAKGAGFSIGDDPVSWALLNLDPEQLNIAKRGDTVNYSDSLVGDGSNALPDFIVRRLAEIRELQESKLSGDSSDESGQEGDDEEDDDEMNSQPPKLSRLDEDENSDTSTNDSNSTLPTAKTNPQDNRARREARRANIFEKPVNELCLCCGATTALYANHPMFEGKMCKSCCSWYKEVCFVFDQDGKREHCSVCGGGGDLFICDNSNCANVFCKDCVLTLDSEESLEYIAKTDPWSCYICTGRPAGLLKPKKDWEQNVHRLFMRANMLDDINWSLIRNEKRPIRVLSLFDGIGTGKVVLDELGLDIGAYYCSEIDPDAVVVTRVNHPNSMIYLGDVRRVDLDTIKEISPIDLLIGGSPCNDISIANPKRRGLYDPEGTGILFFEYYRILQTLLQVNAADGRALFWIFENVASMRDQYSSVINRFLGKPPSLYDSRHFSAQNRARYFWGNIPGMYSNVTPGRQTRPPVIDDILTPNCGRVGTMDKVRTVTTRTNSLKQGRSFSVCPVEMDGRPDTLWPTELETLFGLPRHYTDVGSLAPTKRQKLIGQGWTVPVVQHILHPLQRFFKTKDPK